MCVVCKKKEVVMRERVIVSVREYVCMSPCARTCKRIHEKE